jgi:uncharacterized protein (TIGR02757 family)
MDVLLKKRLIDAAERFEQPEFINSDPINLPHRYSERKDIEVSAMISAWMAYGSRTVFLEKLNRLHNVMDYYGGPYQYIDSKSYLLEKRCDNDCLYRFYKWYDYYQLCDRINKVLIEEGTLEGTVDQLCKKFFGINGIPIPGSKSANKRINMFLRWMVRKNSLVDFGLCESIDPKDLVIPLDTHVYQEALKFGLTTRRSADLKTAIEITSAMKDIWPDDPVRGDFALYGLGINE